MEDYKSERLTPEIKRLIGEIVREIEPDRPDSLLEGPHARDLLSEDVKTALVTPGLKQIAGVNINFVPAYLGTKKAIRECSTATLGTWAAKREG